MQNYEFKLTPAYCLYNGAAIVEQKGSYIKFITEGSEDSVLQQRLEKAFLSYVKNVLKNKEVDSSFLKIPEIEFTTGTHEEVRKFVSKLYEEKDFSVIKNKDVENKKNEAAAVLLLDSILDEARKENVSDIHIEFSTVRFRKNGKLSVYGVFQKERLEEMKLRIKLLSGMNVLEKRKAQDGSFVYGETNPLFVRVSSMAVVGTDREDGNESIVLRLLDSARLPLGIISLGFSDSQLICLDQISEMKNGLVLICGPTGSGKSTTAASILMERIKKKRAEEKVISLEDPPEYIIPGVTQIKIDEKKDAGFTKTLEKIFRQDPDVIMIGEIRDKESASVALRAGMTGHLVVATLHTDSAASCLFRMKDLGCDVNILSSILRCVIVQELQFQKFEDSRVETVLMADVAVPVENFVKKVSESINSEDLDDAFTHVTNVPELIKRTGKQMRRKTIPKIIPAAAGVKTNPWS